MMMIDIDRWIHRSYINGIWVDDDDRYIDKNRHI